MITHTDTEISELIADDQPTWVAGEIDYSDLKAIEQGGCASGAYMPAVTYHSALSAMSEHGDDVLSYIEDSIGELPEIPNGESWSGIAVFFLSYAVELWVSSMLAQLDCLECPECCGDVSISEYPYTWACDDCESE